MDLSNAIRELQAEKKRLEQAIASLEEIQRLSTGDRLVVPGKTRGRKSMGASERKQVSARMKRYWELRRAKSEGAEVNPART